MKRVLQRTPVRRLPAGALLLVLTVSLVVSAILLSLIYLAANRRLLLQRDALHGQLRRNLFSGLAYAQAHPEQPAFRPLALDLFGEGGDSVQLTRKPWGVFDIVVLSARKGAFRDTAAALLGSTFSAANQGALYLADTNVPLTVNEDAQVRGRAWLPKAGTVALGSLPLLGVPRTGAPVTGEVQPSRPALPLTGDSALARLRAYAQLELTGLVPPGSQPTTELRSGRVSFLGRPVVWYHAGPYTLTGRVAGQVVIVSARRLVVTAGSQLDNVLLLAPTILVEAGFWGRVQLVARDTVAVGDHCRLGYPSAVCVFGTAKTALVSLGADCLVQGVVLAASAEPGPVSQVVMEPTSTVEGQVFSAGVVQNCGTVRGALACRRLLYHGVGSYYENYLVNCTLDRGALSPYFLTTPLLNPGGGFGVAAWLR